MTTEELARGFAAGEEAAAEEMYRRLGKFRQTIYRSLGEREVEDVLHIVYMRLWQYRKNLLHNPERLMGYVKVTVLHEVATVARSGYDRRFVTYGLRPLVDIAAPEEPREGGFFERAVSKLKPRRQMILHLAFREGLTEGEIGAALGCTGRAVRAEKHRAIVWLRKLLDQTKETTETKEEAGAEEGQSLEEA